MTPTEIAKNHFDEWNDVTGFVVKGSSYYYELLSVIEDCMAAEREACAAVAEDFTFRRESEGRTRTYQVGRVIAEAIRARSEPKSSNPPPDEL
jgi:hypothetical protein